MIITRTEIWKVDIPLGRPFVIARGSSDVARNVFIRLHTDSGIVGAGENSWSKSLATDISYLEAARILGAALKGKDAADISARTNDMHKALPGNLCAKSAFDTALHDIAAQKAGQPLYKFLGGKKRPIETDLTISIDTPEEMARQAAEYIENGVGIIKVKLGSEYALDVERVRRVRQAAGPKAVLRLDANQGWSFDQAAAILNEVAQYRIELCEQPLHRDEDAKLPELRRKSPVKILLDESVDTAADAERLLQAGACDYLNIKFAKCGGFGEAANIAAVAAKYKSSCMIGGMLESRLALTAFTHCALANEAIRFYDLDTCLLGQTHDPVRGGAKFNGYMIEVPDTPGLGADFDDAYLRSMENLEV